MTGPSTTLRRRADPSAPVVAPSLDDPVVAATSTLVGGPLGRHARHDGARRFWTPLRVLLLLVLASCAFGWAQKSPCRDTRSWQHGFQYTHYCYSDVVALYGQEGLGQGRRPYLDQPVEYPVLLGGAMQVAASVADHATPSFLRHGSYTLDHRPAVFYDVTALMLTVAAAVTVVCTALSAGRRRWDAALVALAPALVLHLVTNWDMLAVALAAGGLVAWARRRPALAGVLLGLGAATKAYPVLLLLPLLVLCLRAGRLRAWVRTAGAAVMTAALVYLPVYLVAGAFVTRADGTAVRTGTGAWNALSRGGVGPFLRALAPHQGRGLNATLRFFQLNQTRDADWDSLQFAYAYARLRLHDAFGLSVPSAALAHGTVNTSATLGVVALLLGVVAVGLTAPRRPRLGQLAFLTVVAFLLPDKVFSPQYVLWLVPLAALARPRWGAFLAWQLTEALVLLTRYAHFVNLDDSRHGVSRGWFVGAVCLRDLALAVLAGLVVRDVYRPRRDVVRRDGVDDPAGGLLDGLPDRPWVSWWALPAGPGGAQGSDEAPALEPDGDAGPAALGPGLVARPAG